MCSHLSQRGVEYLVIGGWAAIAHGLPRTTLDVDLFVRPTRENVQRLIGALADVGFGTARELDPDEILGRHALLFSDQIRVDIFLRPWGLKDFQESWAARFETVFESVRIPFLGFDDLIRSKETNREQDQQDVEALRKIQKQEH